MLHEACVGEDRSRSTKPCVFPCKVAGDGDETLLCAAGAAAVVSGSNRFLPCVLQRVDANRGVMAAWMCRCCCKTRCNGCMNVAWDLCWGGSRSTKPCVFPCKVAAGGDETYLVCAAGAAALVSSLNRFHLCVLQRMYAADAHKAHTHEPGWGMAHASSIDEKGRIVYP